MEYGKFMQQLAKGMENKITAYDSKEGQNGCLIYLRSRDHAIFVPDDIIEHRGAEAIRMIREKVSQDLDDVTMLVLKGVGDTLVFQAACPGLWPDPQDGASLQ